SKPLLVAAIDFGTMYSSWAFSFRHEYESDPTQISAKQWLKHESTKGPTTVLIKPDGRTLEAFVFEAETRYAELIDEEAHESYYFFKRFKMKLWNQASTCQRKSNGIWSFKTKIVVIYLQKLCLHHRSRFDAMADLKRNHLYDFIDLFRRFENKKRSISPDKDSKTDYTPSSVPVYLDRETTGTSLESDQSSIVFPIFITYEKNPMYTTDPGCTCVGNLTIPLSRSGKDREVIVRFIFGGTEIDVEATEKSTRKVHHLKIDFLV
ncbi:hypothetical protein MAR_006867, partial [Mya arenaria]